jgi:hypothetical protein
VADCLSSRMTDECGVVLLLKDLLLATDTLAIFRHAGASSQVPAPLSPLTCALDAGESAEYDSTVLQVVVLITLTLIVEGC